MNQMEEAFTKNEHSSSKEKSGNGSSKNMSAGSGIAGALGKISFVELAVLGSAAFVLWKHRDQIQSILKENGVKVPAILTGGLSGLLNANKDQDKEEDDETSSSNKREYSASKH